jgi:F-type H+-transporting ATPase subunit a
MDPIHQFEITNFFVFGHLGSLELAFTKSALFMLISLAIIAALMIGTTGAQAMVPGRMQSIAEMSYEFVANTLQSAAGTEGMKFLPLVFSLFMFVLTVNIIGLVPYAFAVTAQIIVTVSLALLVFVTVIVYGISKNGLRFFKLFVPSGVPIYILPLVVAIEIISFLSRPLSHSVRLFANMLAGHITLNVFGGFVVMLLGAGAITKAVAVLPFAMTIGLDALELLVAFLQAYVFAMLTCMYLNDALHPGH